MADVIWIFAIMVLPQGIFGDPCDPNVYQPIDEPRRSTAYVVKNPDYEDMICDRVLQQGWYKFEHGDMPTTSQQPYHCGTHIPLWLQGTLPPNDNKEHALTACGTSGGNPCRFKFPVSVKNCGTFYVYNLKPTLGCSIGYCAGNKVPCPPDQWSPTMFQPGCKAAYPKMTQSPHLSNPIVEPTTFKFNCDINFDPKRTDVGFQVDWLFDGKPDPKVPKTQVPSTGRQASLDQKYLEGHLGETVSCRVRAYFKTSPGRMSPGIESNGYWAGIKISEASITVGENEKPRTMKIISTIPIVCDKPNQASCKLEIYLDPNNHDVRQTTSCTQVLKPTDWNPKTNTAETTFQVLAERDLKKDGDKNLELHFDTIHTFDAPPIFNNYNIPFLQIRTKDKDTSMCRCSGDPHCSTFDNQLIHPGRNNYNFYQVGEFQMFKSASSEFEVQVRTWPCGRVSCLCAVAAREGNDVFVIDICHGKYGHTFPHVTLPNKAQMSQGSVIQQNSKGDCWKIYFTSGNRVDVCASRASLTLGIQATEADWGHTQGMCGTFDGKVNNDFTHKDGTVTRYPNSRPKSWVDSWRIPLGTSIFDGGFKRDPKLNNDLYFCNCDQKKNLVDCRINGQAPAPAVQNHYHVLAQGQNGGKGRRQATTDDADYDLQHYQYDYGFFWNPVFTNFPTQSGKTQAMAEKLCNDAFNKDPTIQACITKASLSFQTDIDACVEDIKLTDDTSFVFDAIDSAIMACSEVVLKDLSFYNNATGQPPAFITSDVCMSQCSGKGTCAHGTCHCNRGFTGDACEIDTLTPPPLSGILSTNPQQDSDICDVKKKPCRTIFVIGENIMNSPKTKCKVEELQFNGQAFVDNGKYHSSAVVYKNRFNVGCRLPTKASIGGATVHGYKISLTNDGVHYGNATSVFVTDSTCMRCGVSGGKCTIKDNTCLINGNCLANRASNPSKPNEICDPSHSKTAWTVKATPKPLTTVPPPVTTKTPHVTTPGAPLSTNTPHPVAPQGGVLLQRFDIWTIFQTGCPCTSNTKDTTCACCDVGAVQCPAPNQQQCVQAGNLNNCGTPLPGPDYGVDGYTVALADCNCKFADRYDCACCQNGGCQCGREHMNQCVDCKHMDQCGNKPWIFGPAYPSN